MRKAVEPGSAGAKIIAEEIELWARVATFLQGQRASSVTGAGSETTSAASHDAEMIELRDAIAEAKAEDVAPLVEQMMRISAVAAGRRGKTAAPVDIQAPYFGHLRLRPLDEHGEVKGKRSRDVLIGRQGLIDRAAGVQIVDWRDAPVSQIYYRYDEGDDYEEILSGGKLQGLIEARRNVTIQGGRLRRIGCPQGNFFCDPQGLWWQAESAALPVLRGGQGQAARAPRQAPPIHTTQTPHTIGADGRGKLGVRSDRPALTERVDKHLPEIAALIDADQFALITEPQSELVVIQGGAGSGKTTVALHRVAYLAYQDPARFRPRAMLVIVPSEALARYVAGVLPSLGVSGVPVQTSASWMRSQRKRLLPHLPDRKGDGGDTGSNDDSSETPAAVSHLKKHPLMLQIIDRYVEDQAADMRQSLVQALAEVATEAPQAPEGPAGLSGQQGSQKPQRPQGPANPEALVLGEWDQRADQPLRTRCRAVREALGRLPLRREVALRLDDTLRRLSRRAHSVARDWAEILTDESRLRAGLRVGSPVPASGQGPYGGTDDAEVSRVTEQELRELLAWCKAQQEEAEALPEGVDPERYQAVDGRPLDEGSPAGRLDEEDDPLLLRIYQCKHGALPQGSGSHPLRYEHLVLDEAQDLSAVEVRVLLSCVTGGSEFGRPGSGPSVTIAGDVAQRLIFDNGFTGWEGLLRSVGLLDSRRNDNRSDKTNNKAVAIRHLKLLYRSTQQVMVLAREVLGPLASDESEQQATRAGAEVSAFRFGETGEAVAFLGEALRSLLSREPTASVALISRHAGTGDLYYRGLAKSDVPTLRRVARHEFTFTPGVDITDVTQVKGLEFDYVVILDATAGAYPDTLESRHLLHIAITRCAHQIWLIAAGPPSPLVPAHYFTGELAGMPDLAGPADLPTG